MCSLASAWVTRSLYVTISRLRSCAVQVKDCAPVIAHTKERPDNEPVNGELQLKEPQWPHAGNWAGWYKGMKPSLRPWRTSIQKRGFVCSLSICSFPWEKTIQTDLKKRILPYASAPYVTLLEGLIHSLLMDIYVIIPSCQHVYSIETGYKTKRWTVVYLLCSMGSAEKYFLRICSRTYRICVTAEWCVLCRNKAAATLVKFLHEQRRCCCCDS